MSQQQTQESEPNLPNRTAYKRVEEHGRSRTMRRYWYLICVLLGIVGLWIPLSLICAFLFAIVLITIDLWSSWSLRSVTIDQKLSTVRSRFGDTVSLTLSVANAKFLPVPWLELEERVPAALFPFLPSHATPRLIVMFSPRWYERVRKEVQVRCVARGLHTFGPVVMRSGDAFGLTNEEIVVDQQISLLVYPLIVPIESFQLPSRRPFGERVAPRRLLEDPSRTVGVREYVYGDSLRRIDWKASARTMQLQSKLYEASTTYSLVLFVDGSTMYGPIFELLLSAAASVAEWAMLERYAVGLYVNSFLRGAKWFDQREGREEKTGRVRSSLGKFVQLPPSQNPEQLRRIMETLARLVPFRSLKLEELLLRASHDLPAGSTVVVLTSAVNEQLMEVLARLNQRGHAASILFAGDVLPPLRLSGVKVHYLGGTTRWEELVEGKGVAGLRLS